MNKDESIISFNSFSKIPNLIHGFSTKSFGSMKPDDRGSDYSLGVFSQALNIDPEKIVKMHQVHGNNVAWVTQENSSWRMLQTDGVLTQDENLFLSVLAADCIPVLIYDIRKKYIGAVHAGWRGIYNEILKETILQLINKGSIADDLIVGIGPCIRSCCYSVNPERSDLFKNKFIKYKNFSNSINGIEYLDLPVIARQQMVSAGVADDNIEDCNICTYDSRDILYSYRREGKSFGEFVGIIGML